MIDITVAIDKLEKIGHGEGNAELEQKGCKCRSHGEAGTGTSNEGIRFEKLEFLEGYLESFDTGLKGIAESQRAIVPTWKRSFKGRD